MMNKPKYIFKSGIYAIKNMVNGKMYIGSAVSFKRRRKEHFCSLRKNNHYNDLLQRAWNKHGETNFIFLILEFVLDKKLLIKREQYYLDIHKTYERNIGYNLCPKAYSTLGLKIDPKKWTLERKKKLSDFRKQYKYSDEYKQNLSVKLQGENNPFFGKNHIEETKNIISKKNSGLNSWSAKINWEIAENIRIDYASGLYSQVELSNKYNIDNSQICRIVQNKSWKRENKE